jgi:HlyD family secretion protein
MRNIADIKELSDSRELLEKKPPHFINGFIYIFLALLITLIIWSYFGQKEVVVKAQGIVQAVNTNNIIPLVNGKIREIKVNEGDYVKVGDVLITLDDESAALENKTLKEKIADVNKKKELLKKYETSIVQNTNLFSQNDDEKEYYYKYSNFQNQLNLNDNTQSQETIKTEGYETAIENNSQESNALQSQISILEDENNRLLTNQNEIKDTITNYENQINSIRNNESIEDNNSLEIQEIQAKLDKISSVVTKNETQISQNQQMIQTYKNELKSYQTNIENSQQSISISNSMSKRYDIESEKYINNELSQTQSQIKEKEDQIKEYTSQLKESDIKLQNYVIKAQLNGYIHYISPLNTNDVLQAGNEIIRINADEANQLKIELYIPSKEISNIAKDQTVKVHSYSLPYQEYGFIESKVNRLDIDSSMTEDNSGSYYKAEILIDKKTLKGSNGKEADLKIGMPIEGQIITEQKSYLQLFLEKLELWING